MSTITIYHGSSHIIEKPVYGGGNFHNDYGRGFYCTREPELAKEWACSVEGNGYANRYLLEMDDLSVLNLCTKDYHILNWLAILVENRSFDSGSDLAKQGKKYLIEHFRPDYSSYDIIQGYRADDSYFAFAKAFLNNAISLTTLDKAMRLGKLGEQIVLKSEKAFAQLSYDGYEYADREIYFPQKAARDVKARADYQKMKGTAGIEGVYLIDIMRQRWENDDERL